MNAERIFAFQSVTKEAKEPLEKLWSCVMNWMPDVRDNEDQDLLDLVVEGWGFSLTKTGESHPN